MNPSDFHNGPPRFRFLIRSSRQSPRHPYGSPALGNLTSNTCRPCYPDGSRAWLPLPAHPHYGLPYTDTRSATALSLRGYIWVHLRYGLHLCRKKLTTLDYSNASPSCYQGVWTIPWTGL